MSPKVIDVVRVLPLACGLAATGAAAQTFPSSAGPIEVVTVARGLEYPWGLAFLPDGRMLVTERPGRVRVVASDGQVSPPLAGAPKPYVGGQAGLLDIALDREFASNRLVYLCFTSERGGNAAVARARFADGQPARLDDMQIIFRQQGPGGSNNHGCRIAQADDATLFVSLGDHFGPRVEAQNLANHNGKIVRINPDGSVPKDSPFVDRAGAKPEIWAYGVRNPQGLAVHPQTRRLWQHEHGPRGGDEINVIEKGKNYGWPVIGYGVDYSGAVIHEGTHKAGMEQPLWHWTPSIAPSGMAFYTSDLFPAWKGHLFIGTLRAGMVVRLELDGEKVVREERLLERLGERIRDVRSGPDGALYLLTDNSDGRVLRLVPARERR